MATSTFHEALRAHFADAVPHCRETGMFIAACDENLAMRTRPP